MQQDIAAILQCAHLSHCDVCIRHEFTYEKSLQECESVREIARERERESVCV